jgi:hypothetical protein
LISYGFCIDGNEDTKGDCPDTATLVLQLGETVATWKVSANYDDELVKCLGKLRSLFPLDAAAVQKLNMRSDGSYAAIPPEADRERDVRARAGENVPHRLRRRDDGERHHRGLKPLQPWPPDAKDDRASALR